MVSLHSPTLGSHPTVPRSSSYSFHSLHSLSTNSLESYPQSCWSTFTETLYFLPLVPCHFVLFIVHHVLHITCIMHYTITGNKPSPDSPPHCGPTVLFGLISGCPSSPGRQPHNDAAILAELVPADVPRTSDLPESPVLDLPANSLAALGREKNFSNRSTL